MIAWVSGVVRVMPQSICAVGDAPRQVGEGHRIVVRLLAVETAPVDGPAVEPCWRPGLQPAERQAQAARACPTARPTDPRPSGPPGSSGRRYGSGRERKVPVVRTTAPQSILRPSPSTTPGNPPFAPSRSRSSTSPSITEVRCSRIAACIACAVELAVRLGARPAHGRALAPVEQPELDAGRVGDPAHQAAERIDLADEVPLADAADRGIAAHRADRVEAVGHQRRPRTRPGGRARRLAAGMAAADHDDVEAGGLRGLGRFGTWRYRFDRGSAGPGMRGRLQAAL